MRRILVKLSAHRSIQTSEMAGCFDYSDLHTETYAKVGNTVFACESNRLDLALNPAIAESTRHHDAVHFSQAVNAVILDISRLDVVNLDARARVNSAMLQCLDQRNIRILKIHIFTNHRNIDFGRRVFLSFNNRVPFVQVGLRQFKTELSGNDAVQALLMHHRRDFIKIVCIPG